MQSLLNKKLVLGISGGIAAYKAPELARQLMQEGASVQVVMTEAAGQFVTAVTMQALTGNPVYTSQWDNSIPNNMAHIELSRAADAILIAPASADLMAKLSLGLADDLLSTLCLARDCPLLLAPAMNKQMWDACLTYLKTDESRRYLKDNIIHPVGQVIYNEWYIYLWLICIYHVFLIFIVLANLIILLTFIRKKQIKEPVFVLSSI